jgi:AcrR family transcriptional regulator
VGVVARRVRSRAVLSSPVASGSGDGTGGGRRRATSGKRVAGQRVAGQRVAGQQVSGKRVPGQGVSDRSVLPDGGAPGVEVAEIQRTRLLAGALGAIEDGGYAQMTVTQITRRSRVSRRTFYELFENREACLLALLEDAAAALERELAAADLGGLTWRERVRGGLWVILCFCDREPALARVLAERSTQGGQRVLRRREDLYSRLAAVLDEGRGESARGGECSPLTAEGLVGAAVAIAGGRLLRGPSEPLTGLVGELMSMIVLPYLGRPPHGGSGCGRRRRYRSAMVDSRARARGSSATHWRACRCG